MYAILLVSIHTHKIGEINMNQVPHRSLTLSLIALNQNMYSLYVRPLIIIISHIFILLEYEIIFENLMIAHDFIEEQKKKKSSQWAFCCTKYAIITIKKDVYKNIHFIATIQNSMKIKFVYVPSACRKYK